MIENTPEKNAEKTIKEMLLSRNFKIKEKKEEMFYIMYSKPDTSECLVFFCQTPKLNINVVKEYIKLIQEKKVKHIFIVYKENITSSARKILANLYDVIVELFHIDELQFNITKHKYYRPHTKVEDDVEIRKKFGKNLPHILINDPVIKFHHYKKNDIIKVIRKNGYVSYRIVI